MINPSWAYIGDGHYRSNIVLFPREFRGLAEVIRGDSKREWHAAVSYSQHGTPAALFDLPDGEVIKKTFLGVGGKKRAQTWAAETLYRLKRVPRNARVVGGSLQAPKPKPVVRFNTTERRAKVGNLEVIVKKVDKRWLASVGRKKQTFRSMAHAEDWARREIEGMVS